MTDLEALKARLSAASDDIGIQYSIPADEWHLTCDKPTMLLLKSSPTDLAALLAEVERLNGLVADYAREYPRECNKRVAAEAENERLRAVAEAAWEYRRSHNLGSQLCAECQALSAALGALNAGGA